jgi:hypothetical protein
LTARGAQLWLEQWLYCLLSCRLSWLIWLTVVVLLAVEYGMAASKSRRTHTQDAAAAAAGKAGAGAATPPAAATVHTPAAPAKAAAADARSVEHGKVLEEKREAQAAEAPAWGSMSTEEAGQGAAATEVELPSAVREEGA